MTANGRRGEFTGRHMLAIMLAFFGVVIAVNLTMAVMASRSWTGMVVDNSYVASQAFNTRLAERRAQKALGWRAELKVADGVLSWRLLDAEGALLHPEGAVARFRHPARDAADFDVTLLAQADGWLTGAIAADDGAWTLEIEAVINPAIRGNERSIGAQTVPLSRYRDIRRVVLRGGALDRAETAERPARDGK